jgi:hypothetical protein
MMIIMLERSPAPGLEGVPPCQTLPGPGTRCLEIRRDMAVISVSREVNRIFFTMHPFFENSPFRQVKV